MYTPTFSRLLVFLSVFLLAASASAKPTRVTKNRLAGSTAKRAVQNNTPLKQLNVNHDPSRHHLVKRAGPSGAPNGPAISDTLTVDSPGADPLTVISAADSTLGATSGSSSSGIVAAAIQASSLNGGSLSGNAPSLNGGTTGAGITAFNTANPISQGTLNGPAGSLTTSGGTAGNGVTLTGNTLNPQDNTVITANAPPPSVGGSSSSSASGILSGLANVVSGPDSLSGVGVSLNTVGGILPLGSNPIHNGQTTDVTTGLVAAGVNPGPSLGGSTPASGAASLTANDLSASGLLPGGLSVLGPVLNSVPDASSLSSTVQNSIAGPGGSLLGVLTVDGNPIGSGFNTATNPTVAPGISVDGVLPDGTVPGTQSGACSLSTTVTGGANSPGTAQGSRKAA